MARYAASRELLAPRADVWSFLAEPYHLPDWWPGIAGVEPDRRGLAPGARWQIRADERPRLFRKPGAGGILLVRAVEPERRLAFQLVQERVDVEVTLADAGAGRTLTDVSVEGSFLSGVSRKTPVRALGRLYALCQTGAT